MRAAEVAGGVVAWAVFDFGVDFSDIFADYAESQEYHARAEPYRKDEGGPADSGVACQVADGYIYSDSESYEHKDYPHEEDHSDGLDREGGDAVDCEGEHFLQRVFGFSGLAFLAVVIYASLPVAYQRDNAAQE